MHHLDALVKATGLVAGAILAAWTLAARLDAALVDHLDATFATRAQIEVLEVKIDTLVKMLEEHYHERAPFPSPKAPPLLRSKSKP